MADGAAPGYFRRTIGGSRVPIAMADPILHRLDVGARCHASHPPRLPIGRVDQESLACRPGVTLQSPSRLSDGKGFITSKSADRNVRSHGGWSPTQKLSPIRNEKSASQLPCSAIANHRVGDRRVPPTERRDERPRTRCTRTLPEANRGQFPRARRSACTTFSPELSSQRTCGYPGAEPPRRRETVELLSRALPAGRVGPLKAIFPRLLHPGGVRDRF